MEGLATPPESPHNAPRRRTDLAQRRVLPPIIEHLDVVEQLHLGLPEAVEAIGQFALDRWDAALHHRFVIAVAATAHAAGDVVRGEEVLVVLARPSGAAARGRVIGASAPSRAP